MEENPRQPLGACATFGTWRGPEYQNSDSSGTRASLGLEAPSCLPHTTSGLLHPVHDLSSHMSPQLPGGLRGPAEGLPIEGFGSGRGWVLGCCISSSGWEAAGGGQGCSAEGHRGPVGHAPVVSQCQCEVAASARHLDLRQCKMPRSLPGIPHCQGEVGEVRAPSARGRCPHPLPTSAESSPSTGIFHRYFQTGEKWY